MIEKQIQLLSRIVANNMPERKNDMGSRIVRTSRHEGTVGKRPC